MSLLDRLFAPKPDPRDELRPLWAAVVAAARDTFWYRTGGVADTVAGRFDMICAVLSAVLLRMEDGGLRSESVLLTELFVKDMDGQLREMGVGDVIVGKRMGKLMGALGGRLEAYRIALNAGGDAVIRAAERNLTLVQGADPAVAAGRLAQFADHLGERSDAELLAGAIEL